MFFKKEKKFIDRKHISGTPLIRSPMGQKKLALLTEWPYLRGFFTRKCMAVFARRRACRTTEVAVRRGFTLMFFNNHVFAGLSLIQCFCRSNIAVYRSA